MDIRYGYTDIDADIPIRGIGITNVSGIILLYAGTVSTWLEGPWPLVSHLTYKPRRDLVRVGDRAYHTAPA